MAQTNVQQNLIPNEAELSDLLALFRKDILLNLNCHHVGTIDSFDKLKQTATVTINYKRTYFKPDAQGVVRPELKDYPILVDAPVICLGGGGYALTFPIAKGDECLVIFNDRDIDNWFVGLPNGPVATPRLHAFPDAFALVGLRSLQNVILSYDDEGIALRNKAGTTKVLIKDDSVEISAGANTMVVKDDSSSLKFGTTELTLEADKATLKTGSTMSIEIDNTGKLKITNATGEFMAALVQILTTGSAGGFPFIIDPAALAILQSMKA